MTASLRFLPEVEEDVTCGYDWYEAKSLENIKEAITAWLWAEDQKTIKKIPAYLKQEPIVVSV